MASCHCSPYHDVARYSIQSIVHSNQPDMPFAGDNDGWRFNYAV
jgi:hypothetical protein